MDKSLKKLARVVQHNCHIADARHAGDYTLCVYLLKMREMYRWEQGESFRTALTTDDVGDWLTHREGDWDEVEEQDYQPLQINGKAYDPFDNDAINALLETRGLVYNAGLGIRCRPHFFLGKLEEMRADNGYTVLIAGKEYARDMAAPPAMTQQQRVFVRMESLRRMLWEKIEEWRMSGLDNPVGRAAAHYDFDGDVELALDKMAGVEAEVVVAHEIGEIRAGQIFGEAWLDMLANLPRTHAEIMLRAVRDHLADALETLPLLLEKQNPACIHFYFGNMTAMRKKLAPAIMDAYQHWHTAGDLQVIENLLPRLENHWQKLGLEALAIYHDKQGDAADSIEAMIEERIFA